MQTKLPTNRSVFNIFRDAWQGGYMLLKQYFPIVIGYSLFATLIHFPEIADRPDALSDDVLVYLRTIAQLFALTCISGALLLSARALEKKRSPNMQALIQDIKPHLPNLALLCILFSVLLLCISFVGSMIKPLITLETLSSHLDIYDKVTMVLSNVLYAIAIVTLHIALGLMFAVCIPLIVLEKQNTLGALTHSYRLLSGNWIRTLVLMFVFLFLPLLALGIIIPHHWFLLAVINVVALTVWLPLCVSVWLNWYDELNAKYRVLHNAQLATS